MFMKAKKNIKKKKTNRIYRIISLILLVASIFFGATLMYIDLLPTKYLLIILISLFVFTALNVILLNLRRLKKIIKKVISAISIIVVLVMLIASFYMYRTLGVLTGNGESKYKLENYSLLVLKNSEYSKLKDIKNKKIGYYENSIGALDAKSRLDKEIKAEFSAYTSADSLFNDLLDSKVDAILVEDSIKSILDEEKDDFLDSVKVIYSFKIKVKSESTVKDVKVTKESFAVYISGIDTYGEISSVARSDVNILAVVNPTTKQILLVSIPRDYYVQLHGTTGVKDKLTHAGIYGIDMSIKTIEDLLNVKINYYFKVNFTSTIDIVNALDGVEVYSEYTFVSYSGFNFKKGYNYVNGEQALDFARTRKAFATGDRQRGKNQQALIDAMIKKATSKSIITKYNSLLSAIDGKYQTNMGSKKITSLIKMQLNDMTSWNVTSYSLTGHDSTNYTYTYNQKLYVMEPDSDSISEAMDLIEKTLNGEHLDGSYKENTGTSSKVTKSYQNTSSGSNNIKKTTETKETNNIKKDKNSSSDKIENKEDLKEPNEDDKSTIDDTKDENKEDNNDKDDSKEEKPGKETEEAANKENKDDSKKDNSTSSDNSN